jgi:hypothetical protein
MAVPQRVVDIHARFCNALSHRYFIRLHMSAMLALVLLSGALASRLLLAAGVTSMGLRYPIAVLLSYLMFFGLVRIWLAYVCRVAAARRKASEGPSGDGSLLDGWSGSGSGGGGGGGGGVSSGGGGRFFSGGGGSGGGGSSGGFDADVADARPSIAVPIQSQPAPAVGGGGGGHSGGGGGGFDIDGDGILLLILFVLLVVAIFGAGAYLVYQAPTILSESAFQAVLAGGLVRATRSSHDPGWAGSLLKKTAIPFALVLVLAGVFGWQARRLCPAARTAREVMRTCVFH